MKTKSVKSLYKTVFTFSVTIALVIIMSSSIMYVIFDNFATEEVYKNSVATLEKTTNVVQFLSEYIQGIRLGVLNNASILSLANSKNYSDITDYQHITELENVRLSSSGLYSIYIYNPNQEIVVESGNSSKRAINHASDFYDQDFIKYVKKIEEVKEYTPILRVIPGNGGRDGNSPDVAVYTYFFYTKHMSGKISNIMAFNISSSYLKDLIGKLNSVGNINEPSIKIIDKEGTIVFSPDMFELGSKSELLAEINSNGVDNKMSGYFLTERNGSKQIVVYAKPQYVGYDDWCLTAVSDYGKTIEQANEFREISLLIAIMIVLLSWLLLFINSYRLYHKVSPVYLEAGKLESERMKRIALEKDIFIKRMLEGDIDPEKDNVEVKLKEYDLMFNLNDNMMVALISIDNYKKLRERFISDPDVHSPSDMLFQLCRRELTKHFKNVLIRCMNDSNVIVAFNTNLVHKNEIKNIMSLTFSQISNDMQKQLKTSITMAISSYGNSYKDLPYLFMEATEAQKGKYLYGYGKLLCAWDILTDDEQCNAYPKEIEEQIVKSLFAGDFEQTNLQFGLFIQRISNMKLEEMQISFMQLAYAIKYGSKKMLLDFTVTLINFNDFFSKIQSLETQEQVCFLFQNMFKETTEFLKLHEKDKYEDLINRVKCEIEAHYRNANFSITNIGENENMSDAYLGRLFKKQEGVTFVEYLTAFRIEEACQLLAHSEKSINQISDEVGFSNSSYFYMVFKKKRGVTPNQYRENLPKKQI